jgi:CO/xanthine dehydrogenase Mo-binding subunit
MEGGAGMGIGSALFEEMVVDKGRILNPNLTDYRLPSTDDIPSGDNMSSMIASAPQRDGPFKAKGLAEGTMSPTAPAIANAIYNAVGVRIKDLPITPEKVLKALREGS